MQFPYYCWPRGKQVTYQNDGGYEQNVDEEVSRFGEETRLGLKGTAVAPKVPEIPDKLQIWAGEEEAGSQSPKLWGQVPEDLPGDERKIAACDEPSIV